MKKLLIVLILSLGVSPRTEDLYRTHQTVIKPVVMIKENTRLKKQRLREKYIANRKEVARLNALQEYHYLCRCVEAEAGNQGELGKAYVTDVILNRANKYNMSITEVINSKNSFEVVSIGLIYKVTVSSETKKVVKEELQHRRNHDILYFREGYYHSFGTPCFSYKDHYFSK